MSHRSSLLPLAAVLLAACGGAAKPKPLPKNFKDMNDAQKEQYMREVVLPRAKTIFVAFDPEKYADMSCKTCHGKGAEDKTWAMPDADIKPLPNTPEGFMAWIEKEPKEGAYAKFMSEKVEPLMGELLQRSVFDPATGQGEVSCATCHTLIDAEGKRVEPEHATP